MYLYEQRRLSMCLVNIMSMQDPPSVVGDLSDETSKPKSLRINSKNFYSLVITLETACGETKIAQNLA
jgi:hypothetical protein